MTSKFSFDNDRLGDAMDRNADLKLVKHSDHHGWNDRDHKAMEFSYGGYDFRLWQPDISICRNEAAILVSCKLDQRRNFPRKDDHVVLLAAFNRDKHVMVAQAGAQSIHHEAMSHTDTVIADHGSGKHPDNATDDKLAKQFESALKAAMKQIDKKDEGMQKMSEATRLILLCMRDAIVLK